MSDPLTKSGPDDNKGLKAQQRYLDRINEVTAYIHDNLDSPLDLDRLADIACMSRFHWHRVYRAMTGETAAQTVRRLRLTRAGGQLANTAKPIADIATRAGYNSTAAFTRAFADAYGKPPASFRDSGAHASLLRAAREQNASAYPMSIRQIDVGDVVTVPNRGSYMTIDRAFGKLFATLAQHGAWEQVNGVFGVFHDDPDAVEEEALRSEAVACISHDIAASLPLEKRHIAGGRHAVLRHTGPYSSMAAAYAWLFGTWLPASEYELRDAPVLETYLNDPKHTPPAELVAELHIPIED